ncbi:hypothetical protein BCD49_04365 [Pseudofrankia sp. EUN1h]|nr:hypothetical protein BCD49_04365 [Pseudofrankia sp. EUN1h]
MSTAEIAQPPYRPSFAAIPTASAHHAATSPATGLVTAADSDAPAGDAVLGVSGIDASSDASGVSGVSAVMPAPAGSGLTHPDHADGDDACIADG